ncbi:uncharacterized protein MYCFIDRAFT_210538, partial [Pseudocercospora fijiensis CIRAD86]
VRTHRAERESNAHQATLTKSGAGLERKPRRTIEYPVRYHGRHCISNFIHAAPTLRWNLSDHHTVLSSRHNDQDVTKYGHCHIDVCAHIPVGSRRDGYLQSCRPHRESERRARISSTTHSQDQIWKHVSETQESQVRR